ncbi:hypothetical protein [Niallia nealsonii]|uniref:Uncharacterized protein n=1 Tax=Niallia nealsonii TaxID=115979 RepID=A0A2N0Z4L3_9BACI|nr:hypothetical protein [Niallia nealsonii]PKG24455.1 hypothetical protein CWS01_06535 [Niallia nealsonii]
MSEPTSSQKIQEEDYVWDSKERKYLKNPNMVLNEVAFTIEDDESKDEMDHKSIDESKLKNQK